MVCGLEVVVGGLLLLVGGLLWLLWLLLFGVRCWWFVDGRLLFVGFCL